MANDDHDEALCQSCMRTAWTDEQTRFCGICISEWEEAISEMDCMDMLMLRTQ